MKNRSFMGVATKQDFGAKEKSPLFSFGQPQENTTNTGNQPAFGQPSFGQFGKTSNELTPQTGSAFGKLSLAHYPLVYRHQQLHLHLGNKGLQNLSLVN